MGACVERSVTDEGPANKRDEVWWMIKNTTIMYLKLLNSFRIGLPQKIVKTSVYVSEK